MLRLIAIASVMLTGKAVLADANFLEYEVAVVEDQLGWEMWISKTDHSWACVGLLRGVTDVFWKLPDQTIPLSCRTDTNSFDGQALFSPKSENLTALFSFQLSNDEAGIGEMKQSE